MIAGLVSAVAQFARDLVTLVVGAETDYVLKPESREDAERRRDAATGK